MPLLETIDAEDVPVCADALRAIGDDASSMEEVARRIVRYLYAELVDADGNPACALVRLYKSHPFGLLVPELRAYAAALLDEEPAPDVRCLTLLGTAGDLPEWNDRRLSVGHRALPLPSVDTVRQLPMVSQLILELGLDVSAIVRPEPHRAVELSQRTYHVFHVEDAVASPYVPAQEDFVLRYGIRSALGFGGVLPSGDFYAVVMFSRVRVSRAVAEVVKILALPIRVPLLRFALKPTFDP